jgi:hypothetical protein
MSRIGDPNCQLAKSPWKLPSIFNRNPHFASIAAFFGSSSSFRAFLDLGFDHIQTDGAGRAAAHYACMGGAFGVIRELDNVGEDWVSPGLRRLSVVGWPFLPSPPTAAECAAAYGQLGVLQWLWIKGALSGTPAVGWRPRGIGSACDVGQMGDPGIVRYAARGGHEAVVEFLVRDCWNQPGADCGSRDGTACRMRRGA